MRPVVERAKESVRRVRAIGHIRGMVGGDVVNLPITLAYLAARGVPPNLTLPYDDEELRALVQELAQIDLDCGSEAFELFGAAKVSS